MARLRFYNGKVLKNYKICEEDVYVDGGMISAPFDGPFDREIDLQGNLLMPSFKNAHAHSAMTFLRSYDDNLPLSSWLSEICWPNEAKLSDESVYYFTALAVMEYLSSGITASFDMYTHNDAYMRIMDETGFKGIICSGLNNYDNDVSNIEREFLKFPGKFRLGIHGEYTTGPERLKVCLDLKDKYREPCFTHLAETKGEVEGCISRYGKTPAKFLYDEGFFEYGGGGFHCCYMTDEDIDILASNGLYAVSCPASNLKLASGIAPIEKMRKRGVKIALGTDGAASNNALDMFKEMYLVTALQKYITGDASACPADEVIKMACANSALAMGLENCDDLDMGKSADMIVIDLHRPNMQPVHNLVSNLVYAGSKENVLMTVINGNILYEDGSFSIGIDENEVYKKCDELRKEIFK